MSPKKILAAKAVKPTLAGVILLLSIIVFTRFFAQHPAYWLQLRHVSPWTIVWVLALNALMVGVLVGITAVTLAMCGKHMGLRENFLLTAYASIANFFGPLQSGPGVRAVYLKAKHQVRLRDYTLASLLALGLFAFFSALFLLVGNRPWWQTTLALAGVAGLSAFVIRLFRKRDKKAGESQFHLTGDLFAVLVVLTFLQVVVTVAWYYVELRAVNPHVHFSQAMSYAGAANFALFASLTPDAIGIREAFLVFSQHLHHVSTGNILAANLIDRAAYMLFLLILFAVVLGLHASDRLGLKKLMSRSTGAVSQR